MTLNKCFTDAFDPTMKQAGFSKAGLLYYRMNGTMLQGIFLKTCNPFQICFASFPYWMYDVRSPMPYPDIKKGVWTQEGGFMQGFFYNPQMPEHNQAQMKSVLNYFVQTVLVYLDSMQTEQDYFLDCFRGVRKLSAVQPCDTQFMLLAYSSPKPEILLHQKYFGDLPQPVEAYLDKYFEELLPKRISNAQTEAEIVKQTEKVQQEKNFYLSKIESVNQTDFTERYNTMCADMKKRLEEQLRMTL